MLELSALDVVKCRKIDYVPVHFAKIKISDKTHIDDQIEHWVANRLKGRYCIYSAPSINHLGAMNTSSFLAFEDKKELTYFILACPFLRRN